jgi:hypothetical protein
MLRPDGREQAAPRHRKVVATTTDPSLDLGLRTWNYRFEDILTTTEKPLCKLSLPRHTSAACIAIFLSE